MMGKKMDSNLVAQFQPATLSEEADMWRVVWYNRNPATEQLERIRKTFDLNRIRDIDERRRVANERIKLLNEALGNGWNYFIHAQGVEEKPAVTTVTISEALKEALKIRKVGMKLRTAESYEHMTNKLQEWLALNKLHTLPAGAFTAKHFQDYLVYKSEQGHGNRNLNDHTNYFKTTFDKLIEPLKMIEANPIRLFTYLPEAQSSKFEPLTDAEIERIVPVLYAYNPRFYLYCRFIAYEFIRPYHIAFIKSSHIHYGADTVHMKGSDTKSGRNIKKQLMRPMKEMLIEMGYHKLPGDYYLFGANMTAPSKGTKPGGDFRQKYVHNFEPSPTLHLETSNRASKVWKKLVIDGLGIKKQMYALKHTGSQYFVNANDNADLKFLQQQMEHSSFAQTEIYLQDKVHKKIDQQNTKLINF